MALNLYSETSAAIYSCACPLDKARDMPPTRILLILLFLFEIYYEDTEKALERPAI